jgi:hypothetical protein
MTVVIIINKQWSEPLDNHDSSDYYKKKQWSEPLDNHDSSDYYKQTMVWTTRQPWQ